MSIQMTTLTLKDASKRLGVHPNTLRNWGKREVIRLVRLPGSRYRRVPLSEVQRLGDQMHGRDAEGEEVWLALPSSNPAVIAEGRALAQEIQAKRASLDLGKSLEEVMQTLRGRSWSS